MAINKIKTLTFTNLKPGIVEQTINDGGGLYVRVRSIKNGGGVSFRFRYRFEGKQHWLNLKSNGLADARDERDTYAEMLMKGIDPNLETKLQKERIRQQQLEEQEALAKLAARITVNALFIRWRETDLIERKDVKEITRMFNKDVLPILGELFVEDVRKGHITQVTDKILKRGVKRMAKMILGLMRQMFRFAVDRDIIEFDPTANIRKAKIGGKDVERERVLSELEIRALARQLPAANLLKSTECAIWISLSTLCRIGELCKAKFSDVNFDLNTWYIPAANSKNGKAHTIYLSDFALEQFKRLRQLSTSGTWLFPNRGNTDHVCKKTITVQVTGRQAETVLSNRTKNSQALVLTGGRWTPHDLRRTGGTVMGNLSIPPDVIEKCLNHTEENKVKRVYQRQELKAEQADAWRVLGERLSLLINMDGSNVVLIHSAKERA